MRHILVVEDDPLIALDLCSTLSEAGFAIVGPAHTDAAAIERVIGEGCDLALLDFHLGDHSSAGTARELAARRIPFVVLTGYLVAALPAEYASAPKVTKPPDMEQLLAVVRWLLGEAPADDTHGR